MIGTSFPEYIFIRICIIGLRLVAPVSILYLVGSSIHGRPLWSVWITSYAVVEAAFVLLVYLPRKRWLQKPADHPPLLPREEREKMFERCFHAVQSPSDVERWFTPSDHSELKREDVVDWLLWAIFSCDRKHFRPEWQEELDGYVATFERMLSRKLDGGRTSGGSSLRVTLDPVVTHHRPFIWYMIVGFVDTFSILSMRLQGFRHYASPAWFAVFPPRPLTTFSRRSPVPEFAYWYRAPTAPDTHTLPIVFIHGLGIGLWPYLPFFKELARAQPGAAIIALELMPFSMRITAAPPSREALCAAIERVLAAHGIERAVIAGHSFGTTVAKQLLPSARVAGVLMVDPIPFLLQLPSVAYNFVYRAPARANEWQLWYFAARDPDIARALARHFFWAECVMFREEVEEVVREGKRMAVLLSGEDQIVDAHAVWRYLTGEQETRKRWISESGGFEVAYMEGLDHATVFDTKERRKVLLDLLQGMSAKEKPGLISL